MTNADRDAAGFPSDFEPQQAPEVDSSARELKVTRRAFVAGSAASALLVSAKGHTEDLTVSNQWSWSRDGDGGRMIYTVRHPKMASAVAVFRERSFGDLARINIKPIPNRQGHSDNDGSIDLRLTVAGATLLPNTGDSRTALAGLRSRLFALEFDFFHDTKRGDGVPSIDVRAVGWIFGAGCVLAEKASVADWSGGNHTAIVAAGAGSSLTAKFVSQLFDGLVLAPRKMRLSFKPTLAVDDVFYWRVEALNAKGHPRDLFSLSVRPGANPDAPATFAKTALSASAIVEVWRDIFADTDQGSTPKALDQSAVSNKPEDGIEIGSPTGSITRARFLDPQVIGQQLVLAEQQPPKKSKAGVIRPIIADFAIASSLQSKADYPFEWARWATDDGREVVCAKVVGSGDLIVEAASAKDGVTRSFIEGPFPLAPGDLRLFKLVGGNDLELDTRFPLTAGSFSILTAFGTFSAEGPEPKRADGDSTREPRPVRMRALNWTTVKHFEATANLFDASIALARSPSGAAQVLAGGADHFGRLDFLGGAQVTFLLSCVADLADRKPEIGRILLGFSPSAMNVPSPPCSIPMESALLRLVRSRDLVDLRYRFAGLDLVNDGTKTSLRPRGLAAVARLGDPENRDDGRGVTSLPANSGKGSSENTTVAKSSSPDDPKVGEVADEGVLSGAVYDPRPFIVVEFPPQHRAEEAFFQRRPSRPGPVKLPLWLHSDEAVLQGLDELHRMFVVPASSAEQLATERASIRAALLKALVDISEKKDYAALTTLLDPLQPGALDPPLIPPKEKAKKDELGTFLAFANSFAEHVKDVPLPLEQKLYIGREFLDPDALLYAEQTAKLAQESALTDDGYNPLFDGMPTDPVSDEEIDAIAKNTGKAKNDPAVTKEVEALQKLRDPYYPDFKKQYETEFTKAVYPKGFTGDPKAIQIFDGRDELRELLLGLLRQVGDEKPENPDYATKKAALADWLKKPDGIFAKLKKVIGTINRPSDPSGDEMPVRPVQSRLAGRSRLAFRVNTDDYQDTGGEIPFTVDELTNFSRFELSVVRRAQRLFRTYQDGTRRPMWDAERDQDLARMLVHQGFSRGGYGNLAPPTSPDDLCNDPDWVDPSGMNWQEARISVDQRLAEVVKLASEPPTLFETAIEMPFRLHLSPSQDALFRTPRGVPASLFNDATTTDSAPTNALWVAELDPDAGAQTRAVWSPDFRPEVFVPQEPRRRTMLEAITAQLGYFPKNKSRSNRAPLRGPYPPWAIGRHLSSADLTGAVAELGNRRFRTSLDAFDRHELVTLTSVYGLPVMGRVAPDGARIGIDQLEPPPGFQVSLRGCPPDEVARLEYNDIYVPRPLDPEGFELGLTSLGGYLSVNASFEPPAAIADFDRGTLFDALSIERWRHRIVLGRDISAEVVYKGYLMPFGIRAALIKSTERRFERVCGRDSPVAILRQRMFIQIAKPEKDYPAFRQPDEGRRVPFLRARIVTTQSPDIVDPFDLSGSRDDTKVWSSGLIDLEERKENGSPAPASAGTPFWPRTARRAGAEVMFEVLFDEKFKVRMPLVFVDNVTANNKSSLEELCKYYNLLGTLPSNSAAWQSPYIAHSQLVQRPLLGQQVAFAPSLDEGDTQFETESVTFAVEGRRSLEQPKPHASDYIPATFNVDFASDAFMQGADQPPFFPAMRRASIRIAQIDRLTGKKGDPVTVGYDPTYALYGFDPPSPKDPRGKPSGDLNNKRDIFLAIASNPRPKMEFGNDGHRGGAVARPEIEVFALSRSRGPIGSTDPIPPPGAAPAAAADAPAVPSVPEIPPVAENISGKNLKDFFPDNAKLLGLVKLSDLLSILADALGLEPKLREITEFGGGLSDDADTFVRQNVLLPIDAALDAFETRLTDINFRGKSGHDALKDVYPEVEASFVEFRTSVGEALSSTSTSQDPEASIAAYSSVYSSGRRFSSAVERAVRDPITPLREALRKWTDEFVNSITTQLSGAADKLLQAFSPPALRSAAIDLIKDGLLTASDSAATAVAHLIFSIPSPVPPPQKLEQQVGAALEKALSATIRAKPDEDDSPWSLKQDEPLFDLSRFGKRLTKELGDQAKALADTDPVKQWLLEQQTSLEKALQDRTDELQGQLWTLFSKVVINLTEALKPLAKLSVEKLDIFLEALQRFGNAIGDAFAQIEELKKIGDVLTGQCSAVVETLDHFARVLLPIGAAAGDNTVCIGPTPVDWDKCRTSNVPSAYKAVAAVVRLADALDLLVQSGQGKLEKLLQAVDKAATAFDPAGRREIDRARGPLEALRTKLANGTRGNISNARTQLLDTARRIDALGKFYVGRFSELQGELKAVCTTPERLFNQLVAPLVELDHERRAALGTLVGISSDIKALFEIVADTTAGPVTLIPPATKTVAPAPNAMPANWKWDEVGTASNPISIASDAVYFLETAKKDILGAILAPVAHSASFLADFTSLAAFLGDLVDKTRKDAKTAFAQSVESLAKLLTDKSGLGDAGKRLADFASSFKADEYKPVSEVVGLAKSFIDHWKAQLDQTVKDSIWQILSDEKRTVVEFEPKSVESVQKDFIALGDEVKRIILDAAVKEGQDLFSELDTKYEAVLADFLLKALSRGEELYATAVSKLAPQLATVSDVAATGFGQVLAARNKLIDDITNGGSSNATVASLNQAFVLLLSACPAKTSDPKNDRLQKQSTYLSNLNLKFESSSNPQQQIDAAKELFVLFKSWASVEAKKDNICTDGDTLKQNAVLIIFAQVKDAIDTLVRRDFARLIDLGIVRRAIEDKLKELIPTRVTLAYDFNAELKDAVLGGIFIPNHSALKDKYKDIYDPNSADCQLTLKARTTIDLLTRAPPKVDVSGGLGAFAVKLVGTDFDVITLKFDGARYGSDTGGKFKTNVTGVQLGEMVEFLEQFSQYISFGDSGFFLAYRFDLPGIEAGYRMAPIYLTLGALNISNLSLNASCILPFSDGEAIFKVGLSRPESPFAITVGIYGGAGHLALYANASGIIGFSASMEFGAIVDFRLGPVAGRGQVSAGIYIVSLKIGKTRVSTIQGVFTAAGSANIAMFRISAMLQVRVGQQGSGGVAGHAIFVFSFSLGIKDIEFRFVIFKQESKGYGGGGLSAALLDDSQPRFANALIDPTVTGSTPAPTYKQWESWAAFDRCGPKLEAKASCKGEDFASYMDYFSEVDPWIPL
ncbi:hypothetical protein [Mesorhizobium sp. B2-6-2]|uniref:hypothetical protein n=1 Tax=Mesorhizobium sp. B2-6-2 TaxID=2589915 RepID=UPI00112C623C|nr:hypothetical protein [Mesorhizobium sp. B2-6-2]TPJ77213.1 hypothetical protein FJ419_17025 [Mesorhizobium sp. B2-6-2]